MPWRDLERPPTARDRIRRVVARWPDTIIEFCIVLGFFFGLVFAFDPLLHGVPHTNGGWGRFGETFLCVLGIIFMVSSLASALFPERGWGIASTFILSGFGVFISLHPFSVIGELFWILALTGAMIQEWRRIQRTGKP
jgi:hypothetical protein